SSRRTVSTSRNCSATSPSSPGCTRSPDRRRRSRRMRQRVNFPVRLLISMSYKVTALQSVTIRAYVNHQVPTRVGNHTLMKPTQREEWVSLRANEIRDGLGLVLGIHPNSLPETQPIHINGIPRILISYKNSELPMEFHGLFRLEVVGNFLPDGGVD